MSVPAVLFLCTGNSARSQMGEALLRARGGGMFEACSAGLDPKGVHPLTVRALQEIGIDTSALWSKPISEYLGKKAFRFVIVVCEEAERSCPRLYPFMGVRLSWPFEDPAAAEGSEEERLAVFRRVRDALDERITAWLASPASCATEASRASRG